MEVASSPPSSPKKPVSSNSNKQLVEELLLTNGGVAGSDSSDLAVVRLVVIGAKQVGKSALTVRYLTKRFIGEYQSNEGKRG